MAFILNMLKRQEQWFPSLAHAHEVELDHLASRAWRVHIVTCVSVQKEKRRLAETQASQVSGSKAQAVDQSLPRAVNRVSVEPSLVGLYKTS